MGKPFGGLTFYSAAGITPPTAQVGTTAGLVALTRLATGQWVWQNTAGAATFNFLADNSLVFRPGNIQFPSEPGQYSTGAGVLAVGNEYQEAFGTTPATPGATAPGNPFSGQPAGSTSSNPGIVNSQFGTPMVPWGVSLIDVFAVYAVSTAALTTATLAVNRNIFIENTAFVNTAVLAPTAVSTTTTTSSSTPHVQRVSIAQPVVFEMADFAQLTLELALVAPATSVVQVYGVGAHYALVYS
jgi:hypothetical protein